MYCESEAYPVFGNTYWYDSETCPSEKRCVDPESTSPFCALSDEPEPRCGLRETYSAYCEQDILTLCSYDFVVERSDCTETQSTCVTVGDAGSFCAVSETPDPRCQDGVMKTHDKCDGNTRLKCARGYALIAEECENACIPNPQLFPDATICTLSSEPDARCSEDITGTERTMFCKDNALAVCGSGFAHTFFNCETENATCSETDGFAQCISTSDPK